MKIVITSHGELCEGILKSYRMITGDTTNFTTVKLDDNGIGDFAHRLSNTLDQLTKYEQVLILCDLAGGTPYNEAFRYALQNPNKILIVAGFNLPMLIEVGTAAETESDISILLELALQAGQSAISAAPITNNDNEEPDF